MGNPEAREAFGGLERRGSSRQSEALASAPADSDGQAHVRGEYAGYIEGPDDDPHLADHGVQHDASKVDRLAEWYVAWSAGDPRYGEAADLLVALAIVLDDLADALDAREESA